MVLIRRLCDCRLYNHIQAASGLTWGSDYYLFKEGIKPMWEDENNVKGGRWLVVVDKQKRAQLLDHYWLELLMAIIGEQFEDNGEYICGAVVNVRQKGDKVVFVVLYISVSDFFSLDCIFAIIAKCTMKQLT